MVNGEFPLLLGKGKQIKGSLLINELCISHCLMEQKQSKMQTSGIFWNNIKKYFEAVKHFQARSGKIYELVDLLQRHTFLRLQLLLLERKKNVFCFCWLNWSQNNSSVSWTSKHFFQDPLTLRLAKCLPATRQQQGETLSCVLFPAAVNKEGHHQFGKAFSVFLQHNNTPQSHITSWWSRGGISQELPLYLLSKGRVPGPEFLHNLWHLGIWHLDCKESVGEGTTGRAMKLR